MNFNEAFDIELEKIASKLILKAKYKVYDKYRVPLTSEERALVMKRKAIWHHGPHGEATPAVWKSMLPANNGRPVYITNTHRAMNTASTVEGAIGRYHKFIKGTA